ncbi:hypothetical protein [Pseudomonas sp. UMAB-08]|uniref:hypothetical protein n=1 Tax=Pseudomonas sp. UMAB-08 TaxID=1365375 RepID=UPI001C5697F4|nr:hypothetical protein [Pseudomonas sp. UMAB-08]
MAGNSKESIQEWLRLKPQTMGWGAILAFDRSKTNTILLHDYVSRFSTHSYLDPVEGYVGDSSTVGQYIYNYVLDYPRLSFENANLKDSRAALMMKVVGGTQVTFSDVPGGREATRVDVVDPLNGPELTLDVELLDVPGSINSVGQVVLDLKKSSNFSLSFSDFVHEQKLGGEFFQTLFIALPDEKRILPISEVSHLTDQVIRPRSIALRTQPAPGATARAAENYGDGAVIVFVAMQGENNGGWPDSTFKYLIPDDSGDDYSATVVLSHKLLMDTIIGQGVVAASEYGKAHYTLQPDASGFFTLRATSGVYQMPGVTYSTTGRYRYVSHIDFDFGSADGGGSEFGLFIKLERNGVLITWKGQQADIRYVTKAEGAAHYSYGFFTTTWTVEVYYAYSVNEQTQEVELLPFMPHTVKLDMEMNKYDDIFVFSSFQEIKNFHLEYARDAITENFLSFMRKMPSISVFVLKDLLFRDGEVIKLDAVLAPGDMAIFGRLAPTLTHFSVTPQQPILGADDTLQFRTDPEHSGLVWTVENILGSTDSPGSINTATGLYQAPGKSDISGAFIRVKVSATTPDKSYSQSVLVSVVVNDVTVNPKIQICPGGFKRTLSAGTAGAGRLIATLNGHAQDDRLLEVEHGKYVYTAPPESATQAFVLDEIVVTNQLTGKSQSAYVLAILATATLSILRDQDASLPANQIRLKVKAGVNVIADEYLVWETLAGSGKVENGIYSQPTTFDQRFALLVAKFEPVPGMVFEGFILLPLPLFEYPPVLVPGLRFMSN